MLNNILYLTVAELESYGVSRKAYDMWVLRGVLKPVKNPSNKKQSLVSYDDIPTRSQAKLPSKAELIEQYRLAHNISVRQLAEAASTELQERLYHALERDYVNYIADYWDALEGDYPKEQATQLAKAAAVLQVGVEMSLKRGWTTQLEAYAELVSAAQLKYLNSSNAAYLRNKIKEAQQHGVVAIIQPKNIGNKAALKYTEWHQHMAEQLYGLPMQYTYAQVHQQLNYIATQKGMTEVGWEWLKHYLARPEIQNRNSLTRYGRKHYIDHNRPHIKRQEAVFASDLWVMDGTRASFAYRKEDGKTGFLDMFIVLDAHSEMVLGWAAHDNEDALMVETAIRRAIKVTGHIPAEILSDNSSAIRADLIRNMFEGFSRVSEFQARNAKVGNARDKIIERWFNTFDSTMGRWFPNWTGEGIKSKRKNARHAPELYDAVKKQLPNRAALLAQLAKMIELYNTAQPHESRKAVLCPAERFRISEKPHARAIDPLLSAHLLWSCRDEKVAAGTITLRVGKEKHFYYLWDVAHADALNGTTVEVRFDAADLSEVAVFKKGLGGTTHFVCFAQLVKKPQGSRATQTEADIRLAAAYNAHFDKQERLREQARLERAQSAALYADTEVPIEALSPETYTKLGLNTAESAQLTRLVLEEEEIVMADYTTSPIHKVNPVEVAATIREKHLKEAEPRREKRQVF